jgi:hypothetical protein
MEEPRTKVWGRLVLTSFVVTLLVFGARSAHLLEGAETWWLDKMANVNRPQFSAPITVVAITNSDFYDPDLFAGMSPLHPRGLARILTCAIGHRPKGVVVDIQIHPATGETAERAEARLQLYRLIKETADAGGPPIILVRDLEEESRLQPADGPVWSAWRALTSDPRLFWADPRVIEPGSLVRAVPEIYEEAGGTPALPTVLGASIAAFDLSAYRSDPWWAAKDKHAPSTPWRIRFSGEFLNDRLTPTRYLTDGKTLLSAQPLDGARTILTDRIVLVGGTYSAGRDLLPTVVGDMAGVYVWAEAIASWIRHDALRELPQPIPFAMEFLVGVVAGLLLIRYGPALGLVSSLVIVGPLTVMFSLLTFGERVLFVNFLPSFVGVYLHYQVETHREIRDLKKQVAEYRQLVAEGETEKTAELA